MATIYKSKFAAVSIPDVPLHTFMLQGLEVRRGVADATLADSTQTTGSRPRVIDSISGKSFTGPQIAKYIRQFAWGLHQRGVNQNDVVAVLSPNTMWYPVMVFGAVAANAIVTTLNPTYTPDEVAFQLKDSGASVLFFSPLLEDTVKAALKSLPGMRRVVAIGSPEFDAIVNGPEVPSRSQLTLLPAFVI